MKETRRRHMCGIFGFVLRKPVEMAVVFEVLQRLEKHQYPNEKNPVGGYGAGVAVLTSSGEVLLEKTGKVDGSPAEYLSRICGVQRASVLIGHVRFPSPEFMDTAHLKETAQPYAVQCFSKLVVISAHNGYVANYEDLRKRLGAGHFFESERKATLIDSEVIPHFFEELLVAEENSSKALEGLFSTIEGNNTINLLQVKNGRLSLHLVHKGKTRGLHVWKNEVGEVVFSSRKEPLTQCFSHILGGGKFVEHVAISYGREGNYKETFVFDLP
ncbi:MAG: hypothetical protein RMJ03_06505 [Nitrososphaerota archaeon]|nr:hypothetical protein [Nitrososphaerota archaeon]